MNPRSSTETFASSIGRILPFRKTMCASLLEPQPECIPGTPENPGDSHRLESDDGVFAEQPAIVHDAQRADALALSHRRDERLLRQQFGPQLVRLAFRHGDHQVALEACLNRAFGPLPDLEGFHSVTASVELHAVEELEAPVEQLLRLLRTRRFRRRAEQNRKQAPAAASRRRDEAEARCLGMAGLDAVYRRIEPQQPIAVRLRNVVVAEFLLRIVLTVL